MHTQKNTHVGPEFQKTTRKVIITGLTFQIKKHSHSDTVHSHVRNKAIIQWGSHAVNKAIVQWVHI